MTGRGDDFPPGGREYGRPEYGMRDRGDRPAGQPEHGDPGHGDMDYVDGPLRDTAFLVHSVMHSEHMRPAFRSQLRAQIVAARAETIRDAHPAPVSPPMVSPSPVSPPPVSPSTRPLPPVPARPPVSVGRATPQNPMSQRPTGQRPAAQRPAVRPPARRGRRRPLVIGWIGAATAAAAAAAVFVVAGLPYLRNAGSEAVAIRSSVLGNISADPTAAIRLSFTQPLDHNATRAAVAVQPFADTTSEWQGDTLVITPTHGFAPNTGYLVTINHAVAKTAAGTALSNDLHLAFGTAARPGIGPGPMTTQTLHPTLVSSAEDGSEAIVARDGSLLLTEAKAGTATGNRRGLVRMNDHGAERLSGNAAAICVSRSGNSIAYLAATGTSTEVVFANNLGTPLSHQRADADTGSPLGWINDDLVTFVRHGQLVAIDRNGSVTPLHISVDVAHQTFAIAPGGQYVYVQRQGVIEIAGGHARVTRQLPGIVGQPSFSADGATVAWIDGSTGAPRLSIAPSAGGPIFNATLPGVRAGDSITNLSVSPDGSYFVYTLTSGGRSELRLASLPDGETLAVSSGTTGRSADWSPAGHLFTILDGKGDGAHIESVTIPQSLRDRGAALEATATAFANAQLSGDSGALRWLAPGVDLPTLGTAPTRATVVWVATNADGTAQARVRLSTDPTAAHPVATQTEETLTLGIPQSSLLPKVLKVSASGQFTTVAAGPQLVHVDTDAMPGSIMLSFDSDLDATAYKSAITAVNASGKQVSLSPAYSERTRIVTLKPKATSGRLTIRIDTGLRDASGHALAAPIEIPVTLGG